MNPGLHLRQNQAKVLEEKLRELMTEHIESLKQQVFLDGEKQRLKETEERLKLIREVSADLIAAWHPATNVSEEQREETISKKAKSKLPGRVKKIIERPNEPNKAEITIEKAEPLYSEIRVENKLQSESGDHVELEPGEKVDVIVEADEDETKRKAS